MKASPLLIVLLAACGEGGSSEPAPPDMGADDAAPTPDAAPAAGLTLRVSGPDGARPADLRVWLRADDGPVTPIDCAQPDACTGAGLHLDATPARVELTLRAAGHRTTRADLRPAYRDGAAAEALTLPALPPPERTDDYATGFGPDATFDDLRALAWRSAGELGPTLVVKWYMEGLTGDAPQVWLQDTGRHAIHYNFVRTVLGRALTPGEFERATYRGQGRDAMAGSLILYPEVTVDLPGGAAAAPITVEFFPTDDLTPEMALNAYLHLEERLPFLARGPGPGALYYLPAGSAQQSALLGDGARAFEGAGARWLAREALYAGVTMQLLNPGVAYGTLRRLTPEQLATEVVSFEDVVLLPRLPNEMPLVGGTISEELQTPLAHVNVAARSRGTPNLALPGASEDPRVGPLLGKLVRFEVARGAFTLAEATLDEARAFWEERRDRERFVPQADLSREGVLDLADLGFADSPAIGVKAANVAELASLLGPEGAPRGFAVPFAEFRRFMSAATPPARACAEAEDDCVDEGRDAAVCAAARALCQPAEDSPETFEAWLHRLLDDAGFRTDSALREAALDALRHVMRNTPVDPTLGGALDAAIVERFGGATPVRLRSSTNAEDLDQFTGAGLYDSTTAYGAGGERASREIRKVWASAFNWRAFEERGFWNVDHEALQVGVLVHEAFPDEQVNGVLITQNIADPGVPGVYVNAQQGEVPVTNPEDGALPEVFSIIAGPGGRPQVARERFSSLSPEAPLLADAEVEALYRTALRVQHHFAPLYGKPPEALALDVEWKLAGPARRLVFKQARPYSVPAE